MVPKKRRNCKGEHKKNYSLVIGQCTSALISTLRSEKEYKDNSKALDTLWFLEKNKVVTTGVDTKADPILSLHKQFFLFIM